MFWAAAVALSTSPSELYSLTLDGLDGKPVEMRQFRGQVLLVVNVASACGLTPQYAGLQALYEKKKDEGLVVLGFPCNQFAGQEPGTAAEVQEFCSGKYGVTFPMFAKVDVNGEGRSPIYRWLIAGSDRKDDIEWNFAKFLVSRQGKVLGRFSPRTKPDDPALLSAIEAALAGR